MESGTRFTLGRGRCTRSVAPLLPLAVLALAGCGGKEEPAASEIESQAKAFTFFPSGPYQRCYVDGPIRTLPYVLVGDLRRPVASRWST